MENKKRANGKFLESHPVAHALILVVGVMLLVAVIESIIVVLASGVAATVIYGSATRENTENLGLISTVITLLAYLIVLLLYWFKFRKELHGFFSARQTGKGLLLGWSELGIAIFAIVAGVVMHKTYGSFGVAILSGLQPGVSEEIMCRIIPISFAMRSPRGKQLVVPVVIITSLIFGLRHGLNIFFGGDPLSTMFQVLYATASGFLFAAIYMRTGNMWITMVLHSITDIIYYTGAKAQMGNGALSQVTDMSAIVFMLLYTVLYFVNAFYIFRKEKREQIPDTWARIWGKE